MWYPAHAYQHTRLREIASPARFSSFLLCCYPNKEPIKMIGKKNYTYLTKDQPYQRQRCGTAEIGLPERSERGTLPAVATTVLFAFFGGLLIEYVIA